MKLRVLTTATMLPALASGYSMRGHAVFGRPTSTLLLLRSNQQGCSPSSQQDGSFFREQRKRAVDRSFEDLMDDLKQREDAVTKSKEWVDRSFGLFSELNRDVGASEDEVKRNEEALQKQQKWVKRVIDLAAEFSRDVASTAQEDSSGRQDVKAPASGDDGAPPPHSIKDGETAFQVAMELPGVKIADIDIRFDEETKAVVISGQRQSIGSDRSKEFSKSFELDETIDTDKITATLSNGILLVAAPKKAKTDAEKAWKIPVMAGE